MAGVTIVCDVTLEVRIGEYPIGESFAVIAQDAVAKAAKTVEFALATYGTRSKRAHAWASKAGGDVRGLEHVRRREPGRTF